VSPGAGAPADPVWAFLAGLVLFLAPGLVLYAVLPEAEKRRTAKDEAVFLVVGLSVAVSAWTCLLLGEWGLFSLARAGATVFAASVGGAGAAWAFGRSLRLSAAPARLGALVPGLVVFALALGLQARPSDHLVGGRDPGAYVASMGLIAR